MSTVYSTVYDLNKSLTEATPFGVWCAARLGECVTISMVDHDGITAKLPPMSKKEFDSFVNVMNVFRKKLGEE